MNQDVTDVSGRPVHRLRNLIDAGHRVLVDFHKRDGDKTGEQVNNVVCHPLCSSNPSVSQFNAPKSPDRHPP